LAFLFCVYSTCHQSNSKEQHQDWKDSLSKGFPLSAEEMTSEKNFSQRGL